jgi:hypothetical protein
VGSSPGRNLRHNPLTSGGLSARNRFRARHGSRHLRAELFLCLSDLVDSALVPTTFERRRKPRFEDFVGEAEGDDAPTHGKDVRVVVLARESGGEQIVAEGGPDTRHLVRGDLLALTAAAHHDAAIGPPFGDGASDGDADRRIVHRLLAMGAAIIDAVAETLQCVLQVLFQQKARVIGADSDPHSAQLYYVRLSLLLVWVQGSRFVVQSSVHGAGFLVA